MSFNSLFGLGSHSVDSRVRRHYLCDDNAASTAVVDRSGNSANGTLTNSGNTSAIATAPTGAPSFITSVLRLDGVDDHIVLPSLDAILPGSTSWTICFRIAPASVSGNKSPGIGSMGVPSYPAARFQSSTALRCLAADGSSAFADITTSSVTYSTGTWYSIAYGYDGTSAEVRVDGVQRASGGTTGTLATQVAQSRIGGGVSASVNILGGDFADFVIAEPGFSTAEKDEWEAGPEPINSVAPVVSGTETVGSSLSCTTGTWGLDAPFSSGSNGAITYTYQWTRSDDGTGTNEADISGATSSSYTLVSGDSGKYIRCRVAASNDGGNDSAADTNSNFTGAISGGGGGGFQAAWATIARRNSIIGGGV